MQTKFRWRIVAALFALVLAASACGGDSSSDDTASGDVDVVDADDDDADDNIYDEEGNIVEDSVPEVKEVPQVPDEVPVKKGYKKSSKKKSTISFF